jgi:hypothetical protein
MSLRLSAWQASLPGTAVLGHAYTAQIPVPALFACADAGADAAPASKATARRRTAPIAVVTRPSRAARLYVCKGTLPGGWRRRRRRAVLDSRNHVGFHQEDHDATASDDFFQPFRLIQTFVSNISAVDLRIAAGRSATRTRGSARKWLATNSQNGGPGITLSTRQSRRRRLRSQGAGPGMPHPGRVAPAFGRSWTSAPRPPRKIHKVTK